MSNTVAIVDLRSGEIVEMQANASTLDVPVKFEGDPLMAIMTGFPSARRIPLSSRHVDETFLVERRPIDGPPLRVHLILSVVAPS